MNFTDKLEHYHANYSQIRQAIIKGIKRKMLVMGSGGSNNFVVYNSNYVCKIIPYNYDPNLKNQLNNDYLEGDIYKKFTELYIKTYRTPHIVGIYNKYIINNIKFIFPNKCLSLDEKLLKPLNHELSSLDKLCNLKKNYNKGLLKNKIATLVLENCPTSISQAMSELLRRKNNLKQKIIEFTNLIRRIIFQFIFTMSIIQDDNPDFIHNDMFLRNILGVDEYSYETNDYVQYNYKSKSYYLPANGLYIKINDFGYSLNIIDKKSTLIDTINNTINNIFEIKNPYRDVYTFFFDLYDGPNVGSESLKTVIYTDIKNKKIQDIFVKILKKELEKYFNYKTIERIQFYSNTLSI